MTQSPAALRMACAMWLKDPATTLTPDQATWMRIRLASPDPFSAQELARLSSELLAWAEAFDTRFAAVVRQLLTGERSAAPGMAGLDILRTYPGMAAREAAATRE